MSRSMASRVRRGDTTWGEGEGTLKEGGNSLKEGGNSLKEGLGSAPPEEKVGGFQVVTLCNFVAEQESYYPLRIKLILGLAILTNGLKVLFIKSVQEKLLRLSKNGLPLRGGWPRSCCPSTRPL